MLPAAGEADVRELAERVRRVIESTVVHADQTDISVTVSLGAVTFHSEEAVGTDDLIRRADAAMYLSKKSGRNKLTFAPD